MGGRISVESVVRCSWNGWPDDRGIRRYAIKPMYEKKYRELINDPSKFVSINDIRLSRESVKKSIKYLREIYRHRIGKTRVISLNQYEQKHS